MFKSQFAFVTPLLLCLAWMSEACAPSLADNPPREANHAVPASFGQASPADPSAGPTAQAPSKSSSGTSKWNDFFLDPDLKALIEEAVSKNQELNMQLQEIIIAKSEVKARQGEYLPKINAGVGAGVEKVGKYSSQGTSDEAHGVPANLGNFAFGLLGSWEIDVWKKLRNATQAANYRYLSTIEGKNFMVTQLVAEIARSYYELTALDNQIEVLDRNISIQTDALAVVRLEKQAARVTELAVQRFEAELMKNQSRKYDLLQQRVQAENRINFLLGRFPQPVKRDPERFKDPLPDVIRTGVPTELLNNRPDVKQAELALEAAKLDVKVAKSGFLPSLSIEAGVGYQSFNIKHLITTPESLVYNLAGNLTAPLLNRQAIKAQYRSSNAKQLQAVFSYERSLLSAYTDVANQLAMLQNLKKSYELESKQVDLLVEAIAVSGMLFQSARADYMEVLLTRRDALDAEMELIETKKQQLQSMVNIYQALGGGWQ